MPRKSKKEVIETIPFTVLIPQDLYADFIGMLYEYNENCDCGMTHTLEESIIANMKRGLTNHLLMKALNKYSL